MLQRYYRMGGVLFCVHVAEQWVWPDEGILADFRTDAPHPDEPMHICRLTVVDQLSEPQGVLCYQDPATQVFMDGDMHLRYKGSVESSLGGAYLRLLRGGNFTDAQILRSAIPQGITSRLVLSCLEAVHHITAAGGFILHASWICYRDRAILFTAPSGTGKSTQAALWERLRGAELINGDRAAVFVTEDGALVRGIPFCGSSGVRKNRTMPLAAVVYLTQAPETTIHRLGASQAFRRLWEGCSVNVWNPADMDRCTQAVSDVAQRIPVFHLACTPDESAVLALEQEGVL